MKKITQNDLGVERRHGRYPLTDFLQVSAYQDVMKSLRKYVLAGSDSNPTQKKENTTGKQQPGKKPGKQPGKPSEPDYSDPESIINDLYTLLDGVHLCKFRSTVVHPKQNEVAYKKQKGFVHEKTKNVIRKGQSIYIYDVGLDSDKRVGFLLKNPFDTIITFGEKLDFSNIPDIHKLALLRFDAYWRKRDSYTRIKDELIKDPKKEKHPADAHESLCDLNLRFILKENGILDTLQIYGPGIEVFFSKKLVKPVFKNRQGKYEATGNRLKAKLENRVITITRGFPPQLSEPLTLAANISQIGGLNQLAKLKKVNLGGTFQEPKLIFTEVELLTG